MINPHRMKSLMIKSIGKLKLNLSGLIVLTEAASGNFVVTPLIAALANAKKVYAVTRDSEFGKATYIKELIIKYGKVCNIDNRIEVNFEKLPEIIHEADIVTNLGFVRPIDKDFVLAMKNNAVVSLMCEAWEFREGDVDLETCEKKGILAMGINEDVHNLKVFGFVSPLSLKMLFDAELEVYQNNFLIISNDKFGRVIANALKRNKANVQLSRLESIDINRIKFERLDAIIVADYTYDRVIIGKDGFIKPEIIKKKFPETKIIQFAGKVNITELENNEIEFYPDYYVGSFKMGKTFGYLGIKPVIDLHTAGLKVGEIMIQNLRKYFNFERARETSAKNPICSAPSSRRYK